MGGSENVRMEKTVPNEQKDFYVFLLIEVGEEWERVIRGN